MSERGKYIFKQFVLFPTFGTTIVGGNRLYGCEVVLKARASRGGLIMKSRIKYIEGVKPELFNGVAGEVLRLNELKLIAVEFQSAIRKRKIVTG